MKFEFRFQVLLDHRGRLEDIAKRDLAEAQRELDDCLTGIKNMYAAITDAREITAREQQVGDSRAVEQIRANEFFMEGQKVRIENERQKARALMSKVEDRQEKLIEAARERKKIDKLRERMKRAHKKEQRRLETKRIDDLVTIRAGRSRPI
jgi:flagellar protein FliJ